MTAPDISVVIVNYNGRHHLERCLPALFASRGPRIEVIVVDNGSSDDSLAWTATHYPAARLIALESNRGFGAANGIGVAAASAAKIAFLNNDTEVTANWLVPLDAMLDRQPEVWAACSMLLLMRNPDIVNALGGGMSRLGHGYDRLFGFSIDHPAVRELLARPSWPTLFPTAAAMLMRKRDFLGLGGFDPAMFMYHEDVDLGWRIWLAGGEVRVCPESVVRHAFGGTTAKIQPSRFRDRMGMRHNLRSQWKCYQPRRAIHALFDQLRLWHRTRAYREMALILGWNLRHLPDTLRQRWRIQRQRRRNDRDLFESGLILVAPEAPWGPTVPVADPASGIGARIRSPHLRLADETAGARLGAGWYPVERSKRDARLAPHGSIPVPADIDPIPCRWTNGLARCWLWLAPRARGQLRARLRPPGGARSDTGHWVELHCGATADPEHAWRRWTFDGEQTWQCLALPVEADADGRLVIELRSSAWAPERHPASRDARLMGCGVYDFRFEPADAPDPAPLFEPARLSIIIPTYNRRPVLLRTLEALRAQSAAGFEVVVVDDGSTDATAAAVGAWHRKHQDALPFAFQLLRQPNLKQGQARNRGLRQARGDLILFLGDDIIPEPGFVAAHLAGHVAHNAAGDVAIIGLTAWDEQTVRTTPFLDFVNYEGPQFGYRQLTPGREAPFTCLYTSNVSILRQALGPDPFDPSFDVYGWEDCELGYRLCREGLRIVYHPDARAVHSHPMTLRGFLKRQTQIGEALETFVKLQPDILSLPSMGDIRWQVRAGRLAPLLALAGPVLSLLDRLSRKPWPSRVYGLILSIAFGHGVRRARRRAA